jgi:hypothetical protein
MLSNGFTELYRATEDLSEHRDTAITRIHKQILLSTVHILGIAAISSLSTYIQSENFDSLIFESKNSLEDQLYLSNETRELVQSMDRNFQSIRLQGFELLSDEVSNTLSRIYNTNMMYGQNTPDFFLCIVISNRFIEYVTSFLSQESAQYERELAKISVKQTHAQVSERKELNEQ